MCSSRIAQKGCSHPWHRRCPLYFLFTSIRGFTIWPSYKTTRNLKTKDVKIPDQEPEFQGQPNPQEGQPCALEKHKQEPKDDKN